MGKLYVLSSRGDAKVTWPDDSALSADAEAAIREADAMFADELRRGSAAFRLTKGEGAKRIDKFDPTADEIVIVPRMAGGTSDEPDL